MQEKNWKKMFILLIGINLVILLFLVISIYLPGKDKIIQHTENTLQGYVPFLIHTEKNNLNEVINHYIKKEASGGPVNYQVVLGDEVELYGTIPLFKEEIQLKMTFVPTALENGDLVLKQNSLSIGQMQLPVTYVLKFIADRYRLPKGVIIQPNEKLVYISMQELKLKSDFKVRVETFNLTDNDISFQLYVPIK
jgi:uncharacterized protein YpmS